MLGTRGRQRRDWEVLTAGPPGGRSQPFWGACDAVLACGDGGRAGRALGRSVEGLRRGGRGDDAGDAREAEA